MLDYIKWHTVNSCMENECDAMNHEPYEAVSYTLIVLCYLE